MQMQLAATLLKEQPTTEDVRTECSVRLADRQLNRLAIRTNTPMDNEPIGELDAAHDATRTGR